MPLRPRSDFHERIDARLTVLLCVTLLMLGTLGWRLYTLQFLQRTQYVRKATENYTRVEEIPPLRGRIFDRNGRVLVDTIRTYDVAVETYTQGNKRVPRKEIDTRIFNLAQVLEREPQELLETYQQRSFRPDRNGRVTLLREVSYETLVRVQELRFELRGIRVLRGFKRHVLHHDMAAHTLGYVNELSAEELKKPRYRDRFSRGDQIGRAGVEQIYDAYLRGEEGQRVLKVHNNEIAELELEHVDSQPGYDLHLTLDARLQLAAERILGSSPGVIIAMDPYSGAIRAIACYPRYDPNQVGQEGWGEVLTDPQRPLFHRAISGAHAPGSVIKIMMSLAGLVDGTVAPDTTFYCSGQFDGLGSSYQPKCWIGGKYGWGHGNMDVSDAMKQSCDVYYYNLALRMGADSMQEWATAFGFGSPTGIDLPQERAGKLPECRYPGDLVQAGIGQEKWLTTPLQVTLMTALVANGGRLVKPHVGDYVIDENGQRLNVHPTGELVEYDWPDAHVERVRHAMWRVVNEPRGTAYSKRIAGFEYAGKTGSAEVIKGDLTNAWFTGFAPYDAPEIVITAFVEMAGHGGAVAAPMVRDLLLEMYPQYATNEGA